MAERDKRMRSEQSGSLASFAQYWFQPEAKKTAAAGPALWQVSLKTARRYIAARRTANSRLDDLSHHMQLIAGHMGRKASKRPALIAARARVPEPSRGS